MSQIVQLRITRPHSQTSRLKDRLQLFAAPVAASQAGPDGVTQVLRLIDTTILPRALTVTTETGQSLRLLVSNRRLMRVEVPGQGGQGGDAPADPDAAAAQFSAQLEPVLRGAGQVRIATARYHTDALFWDVGCGAGRLAALMGVLLQDRAAPVSPDLSALLDQHALARAELSLTGAVLSQSASETVAPVFERLVQASVANVVPDSAVAGRRLECSCLPLSGGLEAVTLTHRNGQTLAIISSDLRDTLIASWHALVGPDSGKTLH